MSTLPTSASPAGRSHLRQSTMSPARPTPCNPFPIGRAVRRQDPSSRSAPCPTFNYVALLYPWQHAAITPQLNTGVLTLLALS